MSLRPLLTYAHESDAVTALAESARSEPQRAFVSASLRPYLLAALVDSDPARPALVVAGDDRSARDLAADLKAFLAPRPVRFYPARGVQYESHLAPPPHLVGLRIAALDALIEGEGAVVVASASALAEKVPDPELRPHGFTIEKGGLIDLDEAADQLVACGYERADQVEDRGQFAIRGDILDVYPATEERAVRCELFDVEVERLTFFSTFTQRSLEEAEQVEIAPAAELAPEHRELAEMAATDEEAPRRRRALAGGPLLHLPVADPARRRSWRSSAEEEIAPSLADLWEDVTTSFHDRDAHHLYVEPDELQAELDSRTSLKLSSISGDQPHEFRAQGADTAARSLREAEPELEKLVRSGYRTVVAWSRQGRGRACPATTWLACAPQFLDGSAPHEPSRDVRRRQPARGLSRAAAQARDPAGASPASPPPREPPEGPRTGAHGLLHRPPQRRRRGARGPRHRPLHRLRDEDRRRRDPRLPGARVQGRRPRVRAERPAAQDQPLRGRRRRQPAAVQARRQRSGRR